MRAGESRLRIVAAEIREAIKGAEVRANMNGVWRRIFDAKYRRKHGELWGWTEIEGRMTWLAITGEVRTDNTVLTGQRQLFTAGDRQQTIF